MPKDKKSKRSRPGKPAVSVIQRANLKLMAEAINSINKRLAIIEEVTTKINEFKGSSADVLQSIDDCLEELQKRLSAVEKHLGW